MVKGEGLERGNVSTRIIGLAQRGQRKIAERLGEDLLTGVM
jgi:hypothetical protein